MSTTAPLHNRIPGAAVPLVPARRVPSLRMLIPAMIAVALVISQFALQWDRPEDGILVGLALGAFLLVPNGLAWALGPVLVCELTIASYYFAGYGLSLRLIVTGLALVIALPTILSANRADPRYRRVFIPSIALLAVATIGNMLFSSSDYTIKYLRYQMLQILALILVALVIRHRHDLKRLLLSGLALLIAAAVIAIWQHFARGSAPGSDIVTIWKGRSVGLGSSPVILANQLTVGLVPILGLLATVRWKRDWRLFALLGAALILALGLYLTYTRSAPLALGPGLLAIGLCLKGQRRLLIVGGVVGAFALFQLLAGTGIVGQRYYRSAANDNSAASHQALWEVGFAIALNNAVIGIGHEHFEEVSLQYSGAVDTNAGSGSLGVERPHNDFLAVWSSWGIAAIIAYIALFVGATKNFLAATRSADPLVRGLAVGGIGWLATYAANSAFHNYLDSSTLLWVFAGLSVVLARNAGPDSRRTPPAATADFR